MKAPPSLGAALLFWVGNGFLVAGAGMAVVLESARLIKPRGNSQTRISVASGRFARCCSSRQPLRFSADQARELRALLQAPNSASLRGSGTPAPVPPP